jgi:hypothetical protein
VAVVSAPETPFLQKRQRATRVKLANLLGRGELETLCGTQRRPWNADRATLVAWLCEDWPADEIGESVMRMLRIAETGSASKTEAA